MWSYIRDTLVLGPNKTGVDIREFITERTSSTYRLQNNLLIYLSHSQDGPITDQVSFTTYLWSNHPQCTKPYNNNIFSYLLSPLGKVGPETGMDRHVEDSSVGLRDSEPTHLLSYLLPVLILRETEIVGKCDSTVLWLADSVDEDLL